MRIKKEMDVNDEITKYYECEFCQKTFTFVSQLNVHRRMHTGEKPYPCDFCEKKYSRRENLNIHIRIHTQEKPYLCDGCDKAFSKYETLKRHRYEHLNSKPDFKFECEYCHKSFQYKCFYEKHRVVHTRRARNHVCSICSYKFFTLKNLQDHTKKIHTVDPEPQKCDICDSVFPNKYYLSKHREQHAEKNKIYACELCGKHVRSRMDLVTHRRWHTGEKPYECDVCMEKFITLKKLKSHEMSHLKVGNDVPHTKMSDNDPKCQICDQKFSKLRSLKQHADVHFREKKFFPCAVCGEMFFNPHTLKNHVRLHTGEKPYTCNVCDKKYFSTSGLYHHKKTIHQINTLKCELCGLLCNTHKTFMKHIAVHCKDKC